MGSPLLLQLPGGAARPHLLMSPPLVPLPEGAVLHLMMSPPLLPLPGGAVLHLLMSPQLLQLPGDAARPHPLMSPPLVQLLGGAVLHLSPQLHLLSGGAAQHRLAVILKAMKCVRATRICAKCFCQCF